VSAIETRKKVLPFTALWDNFPSLNFRLFCFSCKVRGAMLSRKILKSSGKKTLKTFSRLLPVLLGVLLISSLMIEMIPKLIERGLLGHGRLLDMLTADAIGSIAAAHPAISYLLAGELQKAGIDLYAVTAFILAWVTVGIIPLPAEAIMLGWRFSIWRNVVAFFMAVIVAWVTVVTLHV
jgi:uncharacterized membrane protein YraQ (UPF0718 family)